jgi:hypothetical protein
VFFDSNIPRFSFLALFPNHHSLPRFLVLFPGHLSWFSLLVTIPDLICLASFSISWPFPWLSFLSNFPASLSWPPFLVLFPSHLLFFSGHLSLVLFPDPLFLFLFPGHLYLVLSLVTFYSFLSWSHFSGSLSGSSYPGSSWSPIPGFSFLVTLSWFSFQAPFLAIFPCSFIWFSPDHLFLALLLAVFHTDSLFWPYLPDSLSFSFFSFL